jgi:hypothetical protein
MAEGYRFAPTTNDLSRPSDLRLHYEEGGPSLQRGIRVNAVLRLDIGVASGTRRSLREIRPNPELTAMLLVHTHPPVPLFAHCSHDGDHDESGPHDACHGVSPG